MPNYKFLQIFEYIFAGIIVMMGGYGYYHFFATDGANNWLVMLLVVLFAIIELAILLITTVKFSDTIKYSKSFSISIIFVMVFMWLVAGVGIDQSIWSMLEKKYKTVEQSKVDVKAYEDLKVSLEDKLNLLRQQENKIEKNLNFLNQKILKDEKNLKLYTNRLNDTIWNNGKNCDTVDCLARKQNMLDAKNKAQEILDIDKTNLKKSEEKKSKLYEEIQNLQNQINEYEKKIANIKQEYALAIQHQQNTSMLHTKLMNLLNKLGFDIKEPQRAYVLVLSFLVYPVYLVYVILVANNLPEKKEFRKQLYQYKKKNTIKNLLKRVIKYLILTRKRKVIVKEVEKVVEKEIEVEKVVYKDGVELKEVKVEVPHIIEKEVVVEKEVEKPVIQKELVLVPAGIDLKKIESILNEKLKISNYDEFIQNFKLTSTKGINDGKFNIA
jgi:hypothetical protein